MSFLKHYGLVAALLGLSAAQGTAQTVTLSGSPGPLRISTAEVGAGLVPAIDQSTTYSVTIPGDVMVAQKITAALDQSLPSGLKLELTLQAPSGATSMGAVSLSTLAQDVVRGMAAGTNASGLSVRYEFSASVTAGAVPVSGRTVTFTITNGV